MALWNSNVAFDWNKLQEEALECNALMDKIKKIIEDDKNRLQFTPDYAKLSQHKSQLIFIHDDMMQTQPHHGMVQEGSLSGFYPFNYGYTAKNFTFLKKNLGLKSIPLAFDFREVQYELPKCQSVATRIRGEVYAIRPETFISLDTYRQNTVQFKRTEVTVNIPSKKILRHTTTDSKGRTFMEYSSTKEEIRSVTAWMYVAREDYWKEQLLSDSGFFDFTPIDIIEEDRVWLRKYYQYSRVR